MNNRNQKQYVRIKKPFKTKSQKKLDGKFVQWQDSSLVEDSVEASSGHQRDNEEEEEESLLSPLFVENFQRQISDYEFQHRPENRFGSPQKIPKNKKSTRQIQKQNQQKWFKNDQKSAQKHIQQTNDYSLKCSSNPINKASINNYKLLKTIGKGLYSKVKLAASKTHSNNFYAIKIIKRHDVEKVSLTMFKQILLNEVTLLQKLDHPNIIQLVEYNCDGEIIVKNSGKTIQIYFIVLELVEQGDLFSYIKVQNARGGFNEQFSRYYFKQLLSSIDYLHNVAGIVHRDLKPENILLNSRYDLKVADFGLSTNKEGKYGLGIHHSQVGTRQYQAPEILQKQYYRGEQADIFSMGVILFIMVTGTLPYLGEANIKDPLYQYVKSKSPNDFWYAWKKMFKNQKDDQAENNNYDEINFTSDENEISQNVELEPDQSLIFRVWIDLIHRLWFILHTLFEVLSLVIKPSFKVLSIVVQGICAVPTFIYSKIFQNKQIQLNSSGKINTPSFDYFKEGHEKKNQNEFSVEFKDLVFKMLAYNMVDRPSIDQIKDHPWLKGPTPSQDQVKQAMYRLKSKFIEKEVEQQSTQWRMRNEQTRSRPLPKSFTDYAVFCIRTQNKYALFKGLYKLSIIYSYGYARYFLRCHYCRKKNQNKRIRIFGDNKQEKMTKVRSHQNQSNIPPIWWQNSKVSYSFFASGTSSFLDFSMKMRDTPNQSVRNDSYTNLNNDEANQSPEATLKIKNQQSSQSGAYSKYGNNSWTRRDSDGSYNSYNKQSSFIGIMDEIQTIKRDKPRNENHIDASFFQLPNNVNQGKAEFGGLQNKNKFKIRNNLIDKAKEIEEKGSSSQLNLLNLIEPQFLQSEFQELLTLPSQHNSKNFEILSATSNGQINVTNAVKEEEFEIDETEDEIAANDILKNKLRRQKGNSIKTQRQEKNDYVYEMQAQPIFEENAQDADQQVTRARSYSFQESMFTQISRFRGSNTGDVNERPSRQRAFSKIYSPRKRNSRSILSQKNNSSILQSFQDSDIASLQQKMNLATARAKDGLDHLSSSVNETMEYHQKSSPASVQELVSSEKETLKLQNIKDNKSLIKNTIQQ